MLAYVNINVTYMHSCQTFTFIFIEMQLDHLIYVVGTRAKVKNKIFLNIWSH